MNKMSLQKSIQNFGIKQALKYMEKDPEENIPKLMDMVDKFAPDRKSTRLNSSHVAL